MTLDRIVAYDFIAIYGRHFGIADANLHGDNDYGFSELSTRRAVLQDSLKALVLDGLVRATRQSEGFCYKMMKQAIDSVMVRKRNMPILIGS